MSQYHCVFPYISRGSQSTANCTIVFYCKHSSMNLCPMVKVFTLTVWTGTILDITKVKESVWVKGIIQKRRWGSVDGAQCGDRSVSVRVIIQ